MKKTSLFVSFLIATSTCGRLCMRFSSCVLLLLLLCRAGVHANDPDKDVTSNADEDENTTSSATEMPLVNNETVTEATVVTTMEKTIGPSTTVAAIKPTIVRCQELKDGMSISEMVKCNGREININSTLLDLSHFKDFDIKTLLFDTDESKSIRHLQSSLTLRKSEVTELELSLRPIYTLTEPEYIVTDNNKLANLRINEAAFESTMKPKIIIKGNKLLKNSTLNTLKDMIEKNFYNRDVSKSDIQEAGECRLTTTYLAEFAYLEDCGYFDGPLEINSLTQGIVPNKLSFTDLRGCLVIKNTSIRSLDFLQDLKPKCSSTNEIFGNENLCLTSERKAYWMKWLDPVNIFENSDCSDVCTPKWAEMNRNDTNIKCTKIVGNVDIVAQNDEKELEYLLNVEEIEGHIKITGNTFSNFSFLANLKKINHSDKGIPAISVSNNKNMTIFNIGNLETIEKPPESGAQVVFDKNGNFTFTLEEAGKIFEIAGSATIPKPNNTVTKIVPVVANVTDEGYSEVNNTAKEAAKAERQEEENRTALIAGVTVTVVVLFLVFVGGGIAAYFYFKHRKNNKKLAEEKEEDLEEQPKGEKKIIFHVYGPALPAKPLNERIATNYMAIDVKEIKESTNDFMLLNSVEKEYFRMKQEHLKLRDSKIRLHRQKCEHQKYIKIVSGGISMETPEVEKNLRPYVSTFVHHINYRHYITDPFDYHKMQPYTYTENMTLGTIMDFLNTNLVPIPNKFTYKIVTQVLDHLSHEIPETTRNNQLAKLDGPCHFVGDLNGSIYDLVSIFSLKPTNHARILGYKYVFCGNYIGGAKSDLQTLLVLLLMAKANPNIVLLRGGNEYGSRAKDFLGSAFKHHFPDIEDEKKDKLMNAFLEIFNKMPMGALINEKILAIYGGISDRMLASPNIDALFDSIPMPLPPNPSPATTRLVEDILYSEPSTISHPINILGAGGYFSERLLKKFRGLMKLDLIVTGRAELGYSVLMNNRLIQLSGCTDGLLAKHGVHYAFRKPAVVDYLYGSYKNDLCPAGTLRVENNGELQIMTLRHIYPTHLPEVEEFKKTVENWQLAQFTKEQSLRDKWTKDFKSKDVKQYEEQLQAVKKELEENLEKIDAAEKKFLGEVPKLLDENKKLWKKKFLRLDLDPFAFSDYHKDDLIRIHQTALYDHITVEEAIDLYILYNMIMGKHIHDDKHQRTRQELSLMDYGLSEKQAKLFWAQCEEAKNAFLSAYSDDLEYYIGKLVKMYGRYLYCAIHKEDTPLLKELLSRSFK